MRDNTFPLTEKSKMLLDMFTTIPPAFDAAKTYLQENPLPPDEISWIATVCAEICSQDDDFIYDTMEEWCENSNGAVSPGIIQGVLSAYIYDIVSFLLPYGLNPNAIYPICGSTYNIMSSVLYIDNEYVAADTLQLLLEAGGDPNLRVDGSSIFEDFTDEIWFGSVEQEIRWRYDSWVHVWMVLLAYGGEISGKGPMVTTFREYENYRTQETFDLKKLRSHRNYSYCLSKENGSVIMHIFDKNTFWEVARS